MQHAACFLDRLCTPDKLAHANQKYGVNMTAEDYKAQLWKDVVDGIIMFTTRHGIDRQRLNEDLASLVEYGRAMGYQDRVSYTTPSSEPSNE